MQPGRRRDPAMSSALPDRYLTPEDIAALFDVPLETVYQWRRKRIGPPGFRVGKHLRYDPADVQRWTAERKAAHSAA
ncbi:helix-turn-helix domain-containing protein [Streptomyces aureoversilis]|uniref:Helix-turn-helix domain-containing protein n=1 Tax=Streptomyces aureoversilis TaxID=67277 RepID=A0ABV9ZRN1_9ACTN